MALEAKLSSYEITALGDLTSLRNGHVIAILKTFPKSFPFKVQRTLDFLPDSMNIFLDVSNIGDVYRRYGQLNKSKSLKNGQTKIIAFLDEEVHRVEPEQLVLELPPDQAVVGMSPAHAEEYVRSKPISRNLFLNVRLKFSLRKSARLATQNTNLTVEVEALKAKYAKCKTKLNRYVKKHYRSKPKMDDYQIRIKELSRKLYLKTNHLSRVIRKQKELSVAELKSLKSLYRNHITELEKKNKALDKQIEEYESRVDELNEIVDELRRPIGTMETKDRNKYHANIRKAVYYCARRQVPIDYISDVLKKTATLIFNAELTPMPSPSSIRNMISEMRTWSMVQSVEAMLKSSFVNIAWDATTVKTKHINEIHVNTDSGHFLIDIATLPGGTTADYVTHVRTALDRAVDCYCSCRGSTRNEILTKIKAKITSTLSDRASVNHCVSIELEKYLGHSLLELNCNVHPLDSLAIAFRKLTKEFELEYGVSSKLFGQDSAMLKTILAISKMRYKNGKGDPAWMQRFLEDKGVDTKLLLRYVGNRFHVLFALCGNIHYLLEPLKEYFTSVCNKNYRADILSTLESEVVQRELLVGGLFGKCLTGPWMTRLYRNDSISNLESSKCLQGAYENLTKLIEAPRLLWDKTFNCFDLQSTGVDPVTNHLCTVEPNNISLDLAVRTAKAFQTVMMRQLARYLDGGELYELPAERVLLGTNAPADNMIAESILGLTDNIMRKSANAGDAYISAKVAFVQNNTSDWIDNLTTGDLYVAMGQARKVLHQSSQNVPKVREEISVRLQARIQERVQRKRRTMTSSIKSLMQEPDNFSENVLAKDLGITREAIDQAAELIKFPDTLLGREFVWIWNEEGKDKVYHYRVVERKKNKSQDANAPIKYKSVYYEEGCTIDDAEEYDFSLHDSVADFLTGDIFFE